MRAHCRAGNKGSDTADSAFVELEKKVILCSCLHLGHCVLCVHVQAINPAVAAVCCQIISPFP